MAWTEGRAVIGTGSPFPPIDRDGRKFKVDQTNNSYIFPGVGLGAVAVRARRISDKMLMASAKALAAASPARNNPKANLLPPVSALREVSIGGRARGRAAGPQGRPDRRHRHRPDRGRHPREGLEPELPALPACCAGAGATLKAHVAELARQVGKREARVQPGLRILASVISEGVAPRPGARQAA